MSNDDRKLTLVPVPGDLARERASADELAEAPRAVQEWYDATAEDAAMDARLRHFLDALAPDEDEDAADDDAADAALDDASDERVDAPAEIGAWLAATARDPVSDPRLAVFVDQLAPAPARPAGWWSRPGTRAVAGLLAAAGLLLGVRFATQARPQALPAAPALTEAQPRPAAPTPLGPPAPRSALEEQVEEVASPVVVAEVAPAPPASPVAAPRTPAPRTPGAQGVPETPQATTDAPASPTPQLAAAPPALRTAGDLLAFEQPWSGQVVPGVDLRLERGFGQLSGTQASPLLTIADDTSIRVDVDRSLVDADFDTFTVRTLSATVRVVGTRYEVSSSKGRTTVRTRQGLVRVECADGRAILVAAGQSTTCSPEPDTRVLAHMDAMDRVYSGGPGPRLDTREQYRVLRGLLHGADPSAYLATTEIVLGRAVADAGYRQALEAGRIDAMCALGWEEPAREAARRWMQAEPLVVLDGPSQVAAMGCDG